MIGASICAHSSCIYTVKQLCISLSTCISQCSDLITLRHPYGNASLRFYGDSWSLSVLKYSTEEATSPLTLTLLLIRSLTVEGANLSWTQNLFSSSSQLWKVKLFRPPALKTPENSADTEGKNDFYSRILKEVWRCEPSLSHSLICGWEMSWISFLLVQLVKCNSDPTQLLQPKSLFSQAAPLLSSVLPFSSTPTWPVRLVRCQDALYQSTKPTGKHTMFLW